MNCRKQNFLGQQFRNQTNQKGKITKFKKNSMNCRNQKNLK